MEIFDFFGKFLTWIIVVAICVSLLYALFLFFVLPIIEKVTNWYHVKLNAYIDWKQRKFVKKRSFKKKYCHEYSNDSTIAARKLLRGYFYVFYDHSKMYNPFDHIISVGAKIRSNKLIIQVVTDDAELFVGRTGETWDALTNYILSSDWYKYEKLGGMKLRVFESSYWPKSFEEDDYDLLKM